MGRYYTVTTDTTVPAVTSPAAGTVSSAGKVVTGSSTLFLSQVKRGAWVWAVSLHEFQRVMDVISDTELLIEKAFSSNLSGEDWQYIDSDDAKVQYMEITNIGGSDTTINNVTFPSAAPANVYTDGQINPSGSMRKFAKPVHVDGAVSTCLVNLTMFGNSQ